MTFTQAQIDALTNAIASGVTQVDYGDKRVTYGSIPEMLALRDRMIKEVQNQSVTGRKRPLYHPTVFLRR
ncbi:MAG TPA: hypothetical protein VGM17_02315 [Rhizomicrobium sp.]|jgi:hypothetical protein